MGLKLFLAINEGSSSLKMSLFGKKEKTLELILNAHADLENIQIKTSQFELTYPHQEKTSDRILLFLIEKLKNELHFDFSNLSAIGHRFIHGSNEYTKTTRITPQVLKNLEKFNDLDPLHNPGCIRLIKESFKLFDPKIPQFAVFDTAFHHTLPLHAKEYAIPRKLAEKYHIRKYGFHGISHAYLAKRLIEHTKNKKQKIISLHLGSGCSITAIRNGISIDTSMGFSPCSGLVMGTRVGDIDFTVLEYLSKKTKKGIQELTHLLNFESGLLGLSSESADFRTILSKAPHNSHCRLALDLFCYRILHYIGAYHAILQGVDSIIFAGGIGENAATLRSQVCSQLEFLGVKLSLDLNEKAIHLALGEIREISHASSKINVYVIATDENRLIAEEALFHLS